MKRGHCTGTKRERKPRQSTIEKDRALGEAIAKRFEGKIIAQLLNWSQK